MARFGLAGAGLGFRRELIPELEALAADRARDRISETIGFFELAPENWIRMGGRSAKQLRAFTERHPFVCHGLSLNLGGLRPIDTELVASVGAFMQEHGIDLYTEHLSWCGDDGLLYDLFPIPCTGEAVRHTAARIRQVQEMLGRRIAIENASYYVAPPGAELSEAGFIRAVLEEADCDLHLDVNNVYVNSRNHGFDALAFIRELPLERVVYMHMAGHYNEPDGLIIDTHGAEVIDPVWALFEQTCRLTGPKPTCLERDFNLPPLAELLAEVGRIGDILAKAPVLARAVACA